MYNNFRSSESKHADTRDSPHPTRLNQSCPKDTTVKESSDEVTDSYAKDK